MEVAIILVGVAIFVGACLYGKSKRDSLIDEGKITARSADFTNYSEFFTTKHFEAVELKNIFMSESFKYHYKGAMNGNFDRTVRFTYGDSFTASLTKIAGTSTMCKYQFKFDSWKTRDGIPVNGIQMNMLLTGIEKAFLQIDPSAQVSKKKNEISTKRSLL